MNSSLSHEAAASAAKVVSVDLFEFQLTGLFVVLATLSLLAVLTWLVSFCVQALEARQQPKVATKVVTSNPEPSNQGPSAQTIAVIAAAVSETLDQPFRIVHISEQVPSGSAWALRRRFSHHTSHKVK